MSSIEDAIDDYVFGDFKDDQTNVIASFEKALELHQALSAGRDRYEIIYCCEGPSSAERLAGSLQARALGYDIALVRGDYWSIVGDFSTGDWAARFRELLNENGLFDNNHDSMEYLRAYRDHREADSDSEFDIVYVVRVSSVRATGG